DYWHIQTDNGTQLMGTATNEDSANWQQGQRVLALIRPDETSADPLPTTNKLSGHVQLVEYVGRAYEALVLLEGQGGADRATTRVAPTIPEEQQQVVYGRGDPGGRPLLAHSTHEL